MHHVDYARRLTSDYARRLDVTRRLSVCLSITCHYCIEMAKHIKLGRPTIFIFHAKRYGNIRMDTALTGALDAGGV